MWPYSKMKGRKGGREKEGGRERGGVHLRESTKPQDPGLLREY